MSHRGAAPTSQDDLLLQEVTRSGYSRFDLPDSSLIDQAKLLFDGLDLPADHEFFSTCIHLDRSSARSLEDELRVLVAPLVADRFPGYRLFLVGFVSKGGHAGAEVDMHQDLTYTDERIHRTLLVWIPLIDVDEDNGALRVVPGSHRWTTGIRPSGTDLLPTMPHRGRLSDRATVVPLRAGSAIAYDPALLHGSSANPTPIPRPALALALAPADAPLVRFHLPGDGTIQGATVDEGRYREFGLLGDLGALPPVRPWTRLVLPADFAGPAPTTAAAAERPRRPHLTTGRARRLRPLPEPGLLADASVDLRLRRDGFAVLPAIAVEQARALADALDHVTNPGGDRRAIGLRAYDDPDRIAVAALVAEHLDGVTRSIIGTQRIIRHSVVRASSAAPGGRKLDRGWTHVDERCGSRSLSLLMCLDSMPIDGTAVGLVRHSHRIDQMLRGTLLRAGWLQHERALQPRLLRLRLDAGDVLILDDATVHAWLGPRSGVPRPRVAIIGTASSDAGLVHQRRVGMNNAARLDIDETFLLLRTPADLRSDPPTGRVTEPIGDLTIFPDELRRMLRTPLTVVDDIGRVVEAARRHTDDVGDR